MASPPAEADPNAGKVPTWGYAVKTGEAQLFHVEPGGKLPSGYVDSPAKCKPAKAQDPAAEPAISDEEMEKLTAPPKATE